MSEGWWFAIIFIGCNIAAGFIIDHYYPGWRYIGLWELFK